MTTPNRPPVPDWYQAPRRVPPHIGPTQRELIARRIRSLRRFLIGASFVGAATFTTLAAYHTESKTSAAVAQTATNGVVQQSALTTTATSPTQSLFNNEETNGFKAESHESDDESEHASVASASVQQPAVTSTTPSQTTSSNAPSSASQSTTAPATSAQTTSRHRTRTASS